MHAARPRLRARLRPLVLLAAFSAPAACRSYATVTTDAVPAGREVRLVLTESGSTAVAPWVGPRARIVDGAVRSAPQSPGDTAYVLAVSQVTRNGGAEESWSGETVTIPRSAVAALQTPKLSAGRSALLGAGVVALALALRQLFDATEAEGSGGRGGGGTVGPR